MFIKVKENNKQLVRGYVVYGQWRESCIGYELAKDGKHPFVGIAYTPWHRHDEDPTIVENETEALSKFYCRFNSVDGCMLGFEYMDYRK